MDQQDGTLTLAPEFKIRSLPDPLEINTKYFSFKGRIERAGDHAIKYLTCFKRLAKQIPLSDYAKFKQDVDKIKRFARERIFLTRPLADALTKGDAR